MLLSPDSDEMIVRTRSTEHNDEKKIVCCKLVFLSKHLTFLSKILV